MDDLFETIALAFQRGGPFMYAIGAVGVLVIAISIDRFIKLYFIYSIDSTPFMKQILKLIYSNNIDRAVKVCQIKVKAALPQVIQAGLMKVNKPIEDVQGALDEASLRVVPKLQYGLSFIATFANVSTLLGLLGTITGLIRSFASLAFADPSQKQQLLAKGIAEAMNCTAFGLIIAVSAILIHSYLSNRASKIIDDIDRYSVTVLNAISEQYRTLRNRMPNMPESSAIGKDKVVVE
ncbi:MAG: MotA/TolQ/ExbB proton channel family protein [Proteobacteria bacterium]|nr:MotA/TolQ/ExbB proton channel family protein [Pseudomonadota bacterium]